MDYYIQSTESDNHAVREAACACIAELGSKVRNFNNCVFLADPTIDLLFNFCMPLWFWNCFYLHQLYVFVKSTAWHWAKRRLSFSWLTFLCLFDHETTFLFTNFLCLIIRLSFSSLTLYVRLIMRLSFCSPTLCLFLVLILSFSYRYFLFVFFFIPVC